MMGSPQPMQRSRVIAALPHRQAIMSPDAVQQGEEYLCRLLLGDVVQRVFVSSDAR